MNILPIFSSFSNVIASLAGRNFPPLQPALSRRLWLAGVRDCARSALAMAVFSAAREACKYGPSSLRESLADQLGSGDAWRDYKFLLKVRQQVGAPSLPDKPSNIGFSLWAATVLLQSRISSYSDFPEATVQALESHRAHLPRLAASLPQKDGLIKEMGSLQDLGLAVGILFAAEAVSRPDLLLKGIPFMPPWAVRLAQGSLALAESREIGLSLVDHSTAPSSTRPARL